MWSSKIDSRYVRHDSGRYCQGDILRDITVVTWAAEQETGAGREVKISDRELSYAVVLTQDCDLEQDYRNRSDSGRKDNDKYLQSILLCPAYQAEQLHQGTHLAEQALTMQSFNTDRWKSIRSNNVYRYHYLSAYPDFQIPELVIDFKHYLTIPRDVLYDPDLPRSYLGSISELFRENLSTRFSQYLCRIGLPDLRQVAG